MSDYTDTTPDRTDVTNFLQQEHADANSTPAAPGRSWATFGTGAGAAANAAVTPGPERSWDTFGVNNKVLSAPAQAPSRSWATFGANKAAAPTPDMTTESAGLTPDLMGTPASTYVAPTSTEGAQSVGGTPTTSTVGRVAAKIAGGLWSGVQHVVDAAWRFGPNEVMGALTGLAEGAMAVPPGGYQPNDPNASLKSIGAAARGAWEGIKSGFYGGQGFYTPVSPFVAAFKGTPIGNAIVFKPFQWVADKTAPIRPVLMGAAEAYSPWNALGATNAMSEPAEKAIGNFVRNLSVGDLIDFAAFGPVGKALTPVRAGRALLAAKPVLETSENVAARGNAAALELNLAKGRLPDVEARVAQEAAAPPSPSPIPLKPTVGAAGKAYRPMTNEEQLNRVLQEIKPDVEATEKTAAASPAEGAVNGVPESTSPAVYSSLQDRLAANSQDLAAAAEGTSPEAAKDLLGERYLTRRAILGDQEAADALHENAGYIRAPDAGGPPVPDSVPASTTGAGAIVRTERGMEVPTRYAIVNADDLIASHTQELHPNPQYPQELQPRNRGKASSELQISGIMQGLQPELLADSPLASQGAPIVGPDMMVESGNARTIALQRAYEGQTTNASAYKQWLVENADRLGLDRGAIEATEKPVLVRVRVGVMTPEQRIEFARQVNESNIAAMSATEQARADAQRLRGSGAMQFFNPTDSGEVIHAGNREFVDRFMNDVIGPNERGQYMLPEGGLNQAGVNRIRNAVFAHAYGDSGALERLAESTDDNVRNITRGMLEASGRFANMREGIAAGRLHSLDISGDLTQAMSKISQLRDAGQSIDAYLQPKQANLFADNLSPLARDILQTFDENAKSSKRIGEILRTYADGVESLGDPRQSDLFRNGPVPSPAELFEAAVRKVEGKYGKVPEQANLLENAARSGGVGAQEPAGVGGAPPAGSGETGRLVEHQPTAGHPAVESPAAAANETVGAGGRELEATAPPAAPGPNPMWEAAKEIAAKRGYDLEKLIQTAMGQPGYRRLYGTNEPSLRLRAGFSPESIRSGQFVHRTGEAVPYVQEGNQRLLNPRLLSEGPAAPAPGGVAPGSIQAFLQGLEGPQGEEMRKVGAQNGFRTWPPTVQELHGFAKNHFDTADVHQFLHDEAVKLGISSLKDLSETSRAKLAEHLMDRVVPPDTAEPFRWPSNMLPAGERPKIAGLPGVTGENAAVKVPRPQPLPDTKVPKLADWTVQRQGVPQQIGEDVQLTKKGLEFLNPATGEHVEILPRTQEALREVVGKALSKLGDIPVKTIRGTTYTLGDIAQLFSTTAVPHGVNPEAAKAAEIVALSHSATEAIANSMAAQVHGELAKLSQPLSVAEDQLLTHMIETGAKFDMSSVRRIVTATQGAGKQEIPESLLKSMTPERLEELRPLVQTAQDIYHQIGQTEFEHQMLPSLRDERYVTHLFEGGPDYFKGRPDESVQKGIYPQTPFQERRGPDTLMEAIDANKAAKAEGLPEPYPIRPGTDRLMKNLEIRLAAHSEAMGRRLALDKMLEEMPHVISVGPVPGAPSVTALDVQGGIKRVYPTDIFVDSRFNNRLRQLMGLENLTGKTGDWAKVYERAVNQPLKLASTVLKFPTFQERVWAHNLLKNYLSGVSPEANQIAQAALRKQPGVLQGPFTVRDFVLSDRGWMPQAGAVTHYDSLPYKDLRSLAESEGVLRTGALSRAEMGGPITGKPPGLLPAPGTPLLDMPAALGGNLLRGAQQVTEHIDNQGRMANFISKLREYGDARIAGRETKRVMFDYSNIAPFEREILRPLFPFYSWTRKSIPYIVSQVGENPGKIAALAAAREKIEQMQGLPSQDHSKDHEWGIHFKVGNQIYNVTPGLPLNDPNQVFHPVATAGRMLTPGLKATSEALANFNPGTLRPAAGQGGKEYAPAPFPLNVLGIGTKIAGKPYIRANYAQALRDLEPGPFGALNEPYGKNPPPLPWLTGSLIHNVTSAYDPLQQARRDYYDQRDEYEARRKVLQQQGVKVPGMPLVPPFLRAPSLKGPPLPPLRPGSIRHKG